MDFTEEFEQAFNISSDVILDDLIYIPSVGGLIPFRAVFDSSYKGGDMGMVVDVQSHNFQAYVENVPDMNIGDRISYKSKVYKITQIENDGTGWAIFVLRVL